MARPRRARRLLDRNRTEPSNGRPPRACRQPRQRRAAARNAAPSSGTSHVSRASGRCRARQPACASRWPSSAAPAGASGKPPAACRVCARPVTHAAAF